MLFGGLRLKSRWGVSSDNVIINRKYYEWIIKQGGSILFSPTFSVFNPLHETERSYAKIVISKLIKDEYLIYSRPLSFSIEDITRNIINLKEEVPLVASIYGRTFMEWETLVEFCEKRGFNALEIDFSLKKSFPEKDYSLTDLIPEIASITKLPLILKVSLLNKSGEIYKEISDIRGLILSPHITYSIGSHVFRVHSTELSALALNLVLPLISELEDTVSIAMISDMFFKNEYKHMFGSLNLVLYDASLLLKYLGVNQRFEVRSLKPLFSWPSLSRDMKLAFDSKNLAVCKSVCPQDSIPSEGKGLVEVNDNCDFCGICLSLCGDLVKMVKVFNP